MSAIPAPPEWYKREWIFIKVQRILGHKSPEAIRRFSSGKRWCGPVGRNTFVSRESFSIS